MAHRIISAAVGLVLFSALFCLWDLGSGSVALSIAPVDVLITFDPGGQSDREARRQQPHLSRILGQQVFVDYKVGGGGALGWKELVRAKPDGYLFAGFNIPQYGTTAATAGSGLQDGATGAGCAFSAYAFVIGRA